MFQSAKRTNYKEIVEGVWGEFSTPAGRVAFLMTKARLGKGSIDNESRLTGFLKPVREILPISRMNFNQLLQRDLDDHRVATKLLPYLLEPHPTGPAFFPPIMAVVLPFDRKTPLDTFPTPTHSPRTTLPEYGEQTYFEEWCYGEAYAFHRMITEEGKPHRVRLGRLQWNDEAAKLVVLDGQHRAMALLAVDRTLNDNWGSGAKYRHFYEHRVRKLLAEAGKRAEDFDVSDVEYPVTICWFPRHHGEGNNPHVAARKLFVDVNKNARVPSKSRLILLSDTELVHIFTRSLLNRLRDEDAPFPLYVVEYDNPEKETTRPVRWIVMTNITMLNMLVQIAVFGPDKYIKNVTARFIGRPSREQMDTYMRSQLDFKDVLPSQIEDGDHVVERSQLGNENFPRENEEALKRMIDVFLQKWGNALLYVLSNFLPYKAHIAAAKETYENWITDDAMSSLARDAMYEGVGMFWTLRSSHEHWLEENERIGLEKPEVAKAWETIEKRGKNFEALRAGYYLNNMNEQAKKDSRALFSAVNTYACQAGFTLTLATLHHLHPHIAPMQLAERLTEAWNQALMGSPVASRTRHLIFSKECKWPLNMLPKMDSPHAVFFRYFFLQLLFAEETAALFEDFLDYEKVRRVMEDARRVYFEFLVDEQIKVYKRTEPDLKQAVRKSRAHADILKQLGKALSKWFGETELEATLVARSAASSEDAATDATESVEELDEGGDTGMDVDSDDDLTSELEELVDEGE